MTNSIVLLQTRQSPFLSDACAKIVN